MTTGKKKAKVFNPENTLKQKVGTGGFNTEDIEKAQGALDNNDVDFAPEARSLLEELGKATKKLADSKTPKNDMPDVLYPILQLKAQGGMFNYPAISVISADIMLFLEDVEDFDADLTKILESFHQSVKVLLDLSIKEADDKVAIQLQTEFKAVCERYLKKRNL